MHPDHAALHAIGSGLEELEKRITSLADSHRGEANETLAADLYEVERSLRTARRLLERVARGR